MKKVSEYIGNRYGNLIVLGLDDDYNKIHNAVHWIFKCDCGNIVSDVPIRILNGHKKSCGCRKKRNMTKHGCYNDPLYHTWWSMMQRCYNQSHHNYERYGKRGIAVCDQWHDVRRFIEWAKSTHPGTNVTLDRTDNNGNYEPSNCRWASPKSQSRNLRNTLMCSINGVTKPLADWCDEYKMPRGTVTTRICGMKWEPLKALTTPVEHFSDRGVKVEIDGVHRTIKEWCAQYGISRNTVYKRIAKGMDLETAITTPVKGKTI